MSERRLLSASEVADLPAPSWLINRILPERALAMVWGESGVGKSFVALDMACSISLGNSWFDRETMAGPVVYVAAEGVPSFKRRLRGWAQYNCVSVVDLDDTLYFADWSMQLHEETAVSGFIRLVKPLHPKMIVVDTLAASALGVEEDKVAGIGPVLKSLLRLRERLEATILIVHHTGWIEPGTKPKHERGSSAYRGAMDTSICITKDPREISCTKQRDDEEFPAQRFKMVPVRWGAEWHQKTVVVTPK